MQILSLNSRLNALLVSKCATNLDAKFPTQKSVRIATGMNMYMYLKTRLAPPLQLSHHILLP
jgi:hypothetical protein